MHAQDIKRYIDSKQFHEAARRTIRAGRNVPDGPVVRDREAIMTKVSDLVMLAIKAKREADIGKILREFEEHVSPAAKEAGVTFLNETTTIDLMPDEF